MTIRSLREYVSVQHIGPLARLLRRLTWDAAMIEARTYADSRSARDSRSGLRNASRRLRKPAADAPHEVFSDVVAVTPEEFERVRQCLNDPQERPSAAALEGAEMLRSLPMPRTPSR